MFHSYVNVYQRVYIYMAINIYGSTNKILKTTAGLVVLFFIFTGTDLTHTQMRHDTTITKNISPMVFPNIDGSSC
jgi:hypothetical protein